VLRGFGKFLDAGSQEVFYTYFKMAKNEKRQIIIARLFLTHVKTKPLRVPAFGWQS
jgi:hypothetical protein